MATKKTSTKTATAAKKKTTATAKKAATKKVAKKATAKKVAKKAAPKKVAKAAKKATAKKVAKKTTAKKVAKKTTAKKVASSTKKTTAKVAKKTTAKKVASSTKKTTAKAAPKKPSSSTSTPSASATSTIVQHVFLAAPRERVFAMLTDPVEHGRLTSSTCSGDVTEGQAFTAGDGYITGEYELIEADKKVVASWSTTEWPRGHAASKIEFVLEEAPNGTELVLTHSGLPPSQAEQYRQGWVDNYWTPMRAAFGQEV
jgi:activator of HSP90 ATPase